MQEQSGDNILMIMEFLNDQGFKVEEMGDSINLSMDSGHLVTINALQRDSDYFWASFETRVADPGKREFEIKTVRNSLIKGFLGLAQVDKFEQTQETDGRFVYVTNIELDNSLIYHGPVLIGKTPPAIETEGVLEVQEVVEDQDVVNVDGSLVVEVLEQKEEIGLSPVELVIDQLETVDAKMLRKSLDMMNLKRSSTVRHALTRLYRSAGDLKEFEESIIVEAKKIVSHKDREELELVKALSAGGFLEPVVELLYDEVF